MNEHLKGSKSFWAPYLDTLPEPNSIAVWNSEELKELQDDQLAREAREARYSLQFHYDKTLERVERAIRNRLISEPEHWEAYSFALFEWAYATIQARAFGRRLPWMALVPFADLLNHGNVQTKYSFSETEKEFTLYPTGENCYQEGEEALNSYGRRSNADLLLHYGFAMSQNEWDEVKFEIGITPGQDEFERKRFAFMVSCVHSKPATCRDGINNATDAATHSCKETDQYDLGLLRSDNDPTMACLLKPTAPSHLMMRFFRIIRSTAHELKEFEALGSSAAFFAEPVSYRNEVQALKTFIATMAQTLNGHPTTLKEDSQLLCNMDAEYRRSHENHVAALYYRIGRKTIISRHKEFANLLLEKIEKLDETSTSRNELRSSFALTMITASNEIFPAQ